MVFWPKRTNLHGKDDYPLWGRTRLPAMISGNLRFWKANSYCPLAIDLPGFTGRRPARTLPSVI
jgi:type IV secretion system protein VirB3